MSDAIIADIARKLARAMVKRAHSRLPEDARSVQNLQTELVAEVGAEIDNVHRGTIGGTLELPIEE